MIDCTSFNSNKIRNTIAILRFFNYLYFLNLRFVCKCNLKSLCLFSSTHERKSKTYVVTKHGRYYLKHNIFTEVRFNYDL